MQILLSTYTRVGRAAARAGAKHGPDSAEMRLLHNVFLSFATEEQTAEDIRLANHAFKLGFATELVHIARGTNFQVI